MITRSSIIKVLVVTLILGLGVVPRATAADDDTFEKRGTYLARIWMDAFKKLDTRNKITVVVATGMVTCELEHVIDLEAHGHFLIVRQETLRGVYSYSLVYPSSILLIKETPRGFDEAKAKETPAAKAVAEPKVVSEAKPAEPAKKGTGITVNK